MDGDEKQAKRQELKQEIATDFAAPDIKDKVVKFADVRGAFLQAARKKFGLIVETVVAHKMDGMVKKEGLPENVPASKFAERLIQAVDEGQVPNIGLKVMKEDVTPMLAEAFRQAPAVAADAPVTQTAEAAKPASGATAVTAKPHRP